MSTVNPDCELFTTAASAWDSMLEDCERAQSSIYFEQYIFQADKIGDEFLHVLVRKARQGVVVRLLLDVVGSWHLFRNIKLRRSLQAEGIEVRWYNPVVWFVFWRVASLYFRDHRKLLLVDGVVAHIGGVGINADMASWRDTHARLRGPVVGVVQASFLELWFKVRKPIPHILNRPRAATYHKSTQYEFLANSPGRQRRYIYYAMREAIRGSTTRIWITMPYFIPDLRIFRTLRLAAKRGLDIRLLVPGRSDVPIIDAAMRSYFGMALKSGIKVYTYQPTVLHAKVLICDETWATFGSMNWDSLSFRFNLEGNIVTSNRATIAQLSKHFLSDLEQSKAITYDQWQRRPFQQRLFEFILWPFHSLL